MKKGSVIEIVHENNNVQLREGNFQTEQFNELVDSSDDDFDEKNRRQGREENINASVTETESVDLSHDRVHAINTIKKIASIVMEENGLWVLIFLMCLMMVLNWEM